MNLASSPSLTTPTVDISELKEASKTSPVVQWLRRHTPNAGGTDRGTKILHATQSSWGKKKCSKKSRMSVLKYFCPLGLLGLPWRLSSKESAFSAGASGDVGSISGLGRSPGGGHGNPSSILARRISLWIEEPGGL